MWKAFPAAALDMPNDKLHFYLGTFKIKQQGDFWSNIKHNSKQVKSTTVQSAHVSTLLGQCL